MAPSLRFWDLYTPWLPASDSAATGILVIIRGKLGISDFDITIFTTEEIEEVTTSLVAAMSERLQDLLPEDAEISIASMSRVGSSRRMLLQQVVVDYKIEMHMGIDHDVDTLVDQINAALSDLSTLQIATRTHLLDAENQVKVQTLGSTLTIDSQTPGSHTISHILKWYPDWDVHPSVCSNDGKHPTYMDDNLDDYLFDSREECCKAFFAWESCNWDTQDLSEAKFFPDWQNSGCKLKSNFEPWETDQMFDTLDDCCTELFYYNKEDCCNAPGLGGCPAKGADPDPNEVYLPDWSSDMCFGKNDGELAYHEVAFFKTTIKNCCDTYFSWIVEECCDRSGGCETANS
jgi:hypothetical protein